LRDRTRGPQWFDELEPGATWASLWTGYIRCGECNGIRRVEGLCASCGRPLGGSEPTLALLPDGRELPVVQAFVGAEGRYEDWVYLMMLEREWKRPLTDADRFPTVAESSRPAARSVIVLVFWSYFETRIERLLRESMRGIPERVAEDLLRRYASVGSRLDRLYRVLFSATYWSDLEELGFGHVSRLLQLVQKRRNQFTHGDPKGIDDTLVADLVAAVKEEHEGWISVFNRRTTRPVMGTPT
jgi:hypothetical protein